MFKFLFGKVSGKTVTETQRETATRALEELNSVLALMAEKPVVSVDLNSGLLTIALPEQMPDEALALPAPAPEPEVAQDADAVEPAKDEKPAA